MNGKNSVSATDNVDIGSVQLCLSEKGRGRPILFLHPEVGLQGSAAFVDKLSEMGRVYVPTHPGYGTLPRPRHISTPDDIAYLYLRLIEKLNLSNILLVGASLGGWIAAEMATKASGRVAGMALISPVGIKVSDEHKGAEILDIFSFHWADLPNVLFHDQRNVPGAGSNPTQLDLEESALAREATALYTWMPYMHNPKLMQRLEMVSVPTACAWGNMDKFTGREYARAYAGCVKSNELQVIDDVGHFPHIERPDEVAAFVAKTFG